MGLSGQEKGHRKRKNVDNIKQKGNKRAMVGRRGGGWFLLVEGVRERWNLPAKNEEC
jgi:hypothetical protein